MNELGEPVYRQFRSFTHIMRSLLEDQVSNTASWPVWWNVQRVIEGTVEIQVWNQVWTRLHE